MKIGVLLSRYPYPLEKGDKLRAFHQIKELSKKHEIYLCAIHVGKKQDIQLEKLSPYCQEIKIIQLSKLSIFFSLIYGLIFSKLPLQVAYFFNKSKRAKIIDFFERSKIDHLYCQLIRVAEYVKDYNRVPKTLDYMDALSRGMSRRYEVSPFYLRPFIRIETTRLKRYEHFIFSAFDHSCIISEQDRDLIVHAANQEISIIRNGVDQDFFHPMPETKKRYDLLFTGNMSYPPNVDTVEYLCEEVVPKLLKIKPDLKLAIAGAKPNQRVKNLKSKHVEVTGWVEDIRDYYAASKVFVAPLKIGSGLQNKLLEAMAMRLPCITSPLANNALKAVDGESILIGKNSEELCEHILTLLDDQTRADGIAQKGFEFVSANYNWESSTAQLEALFLATNHNK